MQMAGCTLLVMPRLNIISAQCPCTCKFSDVSSSDTAFSCTCACMQEDDVIGVLASKSIAELKPMADRILIKVCV